MSSLLPWLAPYSGWAVILALATLGLWLAARSLRSRRDPERRRCPQCDYDMSRSPTGQCSECGRTLKNEREAQSARRRPARALLGLAIAFALPAHVIQMRIRQEGWDYYGRLYPLYFFSPDRIFFEAKSGPYLVQIKCDRRSGFSCARYGDTYAIISRSNRTVWSAHDYYITPGDPGNAENPMSVSVAPIQDIDGDGVPEFACVAQGGGNGGYSLTHIVRLGETLEDLNPHGSGQYDDGIRGFVDLRHDGRLSLVGDDQSFAFWLTPHTANPCPPVSFRIVNRRVVPAPDLMRARDLPITSADLAQALKDCRANPFDPDAPDISFQDLYPPLLQTMLTLIYTGHSPEAYAFLDQAWPDTEQTKQQFIRDFRQRLANSPYRDAIETLGHPPLPPASRPAP